MDRSANLLHLAKGKGECGRSHDSFLCHQEGQELGLIDVQANRQESGVWGLAPAERHTAEQLLKAHRFPPPPANRVEDRPISHLIHPC